jgi:hypothetical protein
VKLGVALFVKFYEEPTLRRRFGTDYEEYCRNLPRWIQCYCRSFFRLDTIGICSIANVCSSRLPSATLLLIGSSAGFE